MDYLVSPTDNFVPTYPGTPTINRYICATVFFEHLSDFIYVHYMTKMNGETTEEAKKAFEHITATHNVKVSHYHSDNALFDTKIFKESAQKAGQVLSF